jgi:purine nucleoside permease
MLSNDELTRGVPFILQLREAAGGRSTWMETLRGEIARRWYEIYRQSDWATLRREATGVFHHRVTAAEAERVRHAGRCVVIRTDLVDASELRPAGAN